MPTKTTPQNTEAQETFPIEQSITALAKDMIKKRPGIYYGNLEFWIKDKLPEATKMDIKLAVVGLMYDEGYFISYEYSVYPPNTVDEEVRLLTRFIAQNKLSFTDYGILYELYKTKKAFKQLSEFTRKVVSQCWSEEEEEVKYRIKDLVLNHILEEQDRALIINWKLIRERVK